MTGRMRRFHRHRPASSAYDVWIGCVAPDRCVQFLAHGNVVKREVCRCGAIRETEINARWVTEGEWSTVESG